MRILVINSDCIQVNSSANLCHLAYIRGLINAGHEVQLLSSSGEEYPIDPAMILPSEVQHFTYKGISLYEKMSLKKNQYRKKKYSATEKKEYSTTENRSIDGSYKKKSIKRLKELILSCYGPHGINSTFVRKAKRFRSAKKYDYVLSISTPASSHLLAFKLISSKHITADHWIQIWEDPWYSDVYGFTKKDKVFKEEKRLLSVAERVCYVSPITLEYQKELFPNDANKMFWQPLPSYYSMMSCLSISGESRFGYFGNYTLPARNLNPFYEAAVKKRIPVTICGDSNLNLKSNGKINIYPRMPLEELRPFEEGTDILVFLCNQKGGQIPGKIYQYAATQKTILFILDGTDKEKSIIRSYFEPFHRFVFCENTVEDIERAIDKIINNDLPDVDSRPLSEFEPEKIVQRILESANE